MSPLPTLALAALLVLPGMFRPAARAWVLAFLATLALFLGLLSLPNLLPRTGWNWSGQVLAMVGLLWVAQMLARKAGMSWREMGFTWAQRPGSLRVVLVVCAAALLLNLLLSSLGSLRLQGVAAQTWAYQATLPGLVEEAAFRGVLLALLDRAFSGRRQVFGAPIGWGAVVVTLLFVALHGWRWASLLGVLPPALLYLWLRARSGSLVAPIVAHNLWNLSVYAARL